MSGPLKGRPSAITGGWGPTGGGRVHSALGTAGHERFLKEVQGVGEDESIRLLGRPARPRRAIPGGGGVPQDHTRDTALYTSLYYTDLYIAAVFTARSAALDTACTLP